MHFTTIEFAVFFLVVLTFNWVLKGSSGKYRLFLLAANLFFYGCLEIRFLPLVLVVGLSNWAAARAFNRLTGRAVRKIIMTANLFVNLGLLAFFKYFEFFYQWLETAAVRTGFEFTLPPLELIFPIGISFFTFQGLSYAIDVYRDPKAEFKSPLDVLLFVSFFPTIMSGPIMRARDFIPQISKTWINNRDFQEGFALILSGLFKKVVLASYLSEHIVRPVFQVPEHFSAFGVLAGVYGYSIQIFCDFSGYSDLAMGLALLMGFDIPENFRAPYTARNLQEFWHRWHISLSTWLRDYLYISLGGNKLGRTRKYINLLITMLLGGLWHGAHARFLLWGGLHGLGLAATHIYQDLRRPRTTTHTRKQPEEGRAFHVAAAWFLTFNFVSFLWVFFRADDASRAFEIIRATFDFGRAGAGFEFMVLPALLAGLLIQVWGGACHELYLRIQEKLPLPAQAVLVAALGLIILKLGPEGVLPFIYFQF